MTVELFVQFVHDRVMGVVFSEVDSLAFLIAILSSSLDA